MGEIDDGMTLEEKIRPQKGTFSSGKAFNLGLSQIGKIVFYRVNTQYNRIVTSQIGKGRDNLCSIGQKVSGSKQYQGSG